MNRDSQPLKVVAGVIAVPASTGGADAQQIQRPPNNRRSYWPDSGPLDYGLDAVCPGWGKIPGELLIDNDSAGAAFVPRETIKV